LVLVQVFLAGLPAIESIALARLLIASIYFFSAVSKLDRSFIDAGGGLIVERLLHSLGLVDRVSVDHRTLLAGIVAAGELLIAVGLCWRRSRKFAWPASMAMHVLLLISLGPWGAQSKPAVLLWNLYFVLQNLVLFGLAGELAAPDSAAGWHWRLPRQWSFKTREESTGGQAASGTQQFGLAGRSRWMVRAIAAFAILFPLTEPFGLCDVWPGWAVYATGPERMRVLIREGDRDRLPMAAQAYVQSPRFDDNLCLVRIDRWSLDTCNAPLYPQNRFRLGVALAIADRAELRESIVVEIDCPADRFTGKRTSLRLEGRSEIVAELQRYWLNGFPDQRGNQPIRRHP